MKKRGKQVKGSPKSKKKTSRKKDIIKEPIIKATKRYTDKSHKKVKKEKSILSNPKEPVVFQLFSTKKLEKSIISVDIPKKEDLSKKVTDKLILLLKVLGGLAVVFIIIFLFYYALTNSVKNLETGENVVKAYVKGNTLYISLIPNKLTDAKEVRFIFLGEKEYYLNINEPKINYEFTAADLGIQTLTEIEKVSVVLGYSGNR